MAVERATSTRRDVLKYFAGGATFLFAAASGKDVLIPQDTEDFEFASRMEFNQGFVPLRDSDPLYNHFYAPMSRVPLSHREKRARGSFYQSEVVFEVLDASRPVELLLPSDPLDNILMSPMTVKVDDDREFYFPLVQSFRSTIGSTLLGELTPGEHRIQIHQVQGPYSINQDAVGQVAIVQNHGTKVQEALFASQALFAVRPDNLGALYNDIDLLHYNKILVNPVSDEVIVAENFIISSEDKGLDPDVRQMRYGRTPDIEPCTERKGRVVNGFEEDEMIVQVPQQSEHAWAHFTGSFFDSSRHPMIQMKTKNNLMGFNLKSALFFFPAPRFVDSRIHGEDILDANPEIKVIGYREESRAFIRRKLPGVGGLLEAAYQEVIEAQHPWYPSLIL